MGNYEVFWSPVAKLSYVEILEYLEENWTEKELKAFIHRVDVVIGHLSTNPNLYPYSTDLDVFKSVVTKQISLFYRLKNNNAELLIFWDNRQNPAKLLQFFI